MLLLAQRPALTDRGPGRAAVSLATMLPSPILAAPPLAMAAPRPSFLAEVAAELLATHDAEALADLVVVVPTRRAVVYLQNELALATPEGEALWAPRIAAMEDYLVDRAGVQIEEPIALQLLLFDIFKDFDPDLQFDHFVGWGGLLLQDFSTLDQHLADTKALFEYLAEAKALERWQLDPDLKTTGLDRYFGFWGQLHKVYLRFKARLKKEHLAYPGLAYRRAVQRLRRELANPKLDLPAHHVFVGLGGLSKAEETFINLLRKVGRATIYLDGDPFYLEETAPNRAGQALRRYWQQWNLPRDNFTYQEHLRGRPHHVRLLGVANASMQGKLAGQLLAEARQRNPAATVAVVLPDETLLLPVLHGLPPQELVPDFNVTMGLSFQSTALFNLVDLLFEVHLTGIREGEGKDFGRAEVPSPGREQAASAPVFAPLPALAGCASGRAAVPQAAGYHLPRNRAAALGAAARHRAAAPGPRPPAHRGAVQNLEQLRRHYPGLLRAH